MPPCTSCLKEGAPAQECQRSGRQWVERDERHNEKAAKQQETVESG